MKKTIYKVVTYNGNEEDVLYKSDVSSIAVNTILYSQKDCYILYFVGGVLQAVYDDRSESYIVNEGKGFASKPIHNVTFIYINTKKKLKVKWGTPNRVEVFDQQVNKYTTLGAFGNYTIYIATPLKFITEFDAITSEITNTHLNKHFHYDVVSTISNGIKSLYNELNDFDVFVKEPAKESKIRTIIENKLHSLFGAYGIKFDDVKISKINYEPDYLINRTTIEQFVCPKCKKELTEGQAFCQYCGHNLRGD